MPINDGPKSNKQHAVPQNIMSVEFKIIGDLTMRQFFYVAIFSALAYVTYISGMIVIFKWPLIIIFVFIGLIFAFVPIEDRGLDEWVINFFNSVYGENQRVWRKEVRAPSAFLHENISRVRQELITLAPTTSRRKLEQYLRYQTDAQEVDPLDIPEQEYIEKIRNAFVSTEVFPSVEVSPIETFPEPTTLPNLTPAEPKVETQESRPTEAAPQIIKSGLTKKQKVQKPVEYSLPLAPITPDRHSGRKFTNLLSNQGTIVLPIKGERVLQLGQEEVEIQKDSEEKARQLKLYLEQVKSSENITTQTTPVEKPVEQEAENVIKNIQSENERLMTEIERLKVELEKANSQEVTEKRISLRELIQQQNEKEETLRTLEQKVQELAPTKRAEETVDTEVKTPEVPNVVAGAVMSSQKKGIPNVLLIIKNMSNDPIRAVKTNALGHFIISNPLPNGIYKITADVNKESGFSFDIIEVEAKGQIISPISFEAKVA